MTQRVTALAAVAAVACGLVVLIGPAAPAWACSCVAGGQDDRADVIVSGTVTDVTGTAVHIAVDAVEKGNVGSTPLKLAVHPGEASCGYDFRAGRRYRVNAVDGRTGLCVGIIPLSALSPPAPTPTTTAGTPEPAPTHAIGTPEPATDRWWSIAAGAVMAAVAAVAVAVTRRRRRRG